MDSLISFSGCPISFSKRGCPDFLSPTPTPTPTPVTPVLYEAEDATLSGPTVDTKHGGYTGSGFADYANASNDYIEWTVNVGNAGTYTLDFRYACGSTTNCPRNLDLRVNGSAIVSGLVFPQTTSWTDWQIVSQSAVLNAGNFFHETSLNCSILEKF